MCTEADLPSPSECTFAKHQRSRLEGVPEVSMLFFRSILPAHHDALLRVFLTAAAFLLFLMVALAFSPK